MRMSMDQIIENAIALCNVSHFDLCGTERHYRTVMARELVVAAARSLDPPYSYPTIAWAMGHRAHTTALTAHQRLASKYPAGMIVGTVAGLPVTFQNLLWLATQDEPILEPAELVRPKAVCA